MAARLQKDKKKDLRKALEMIEDYMVEYKEDKELWYIECQEGYIFLILGKKTKSPYIKFLFALASVECFAVKDRASGPCAISLLFLADMTGSLLYLKKCVKKAKEGLSLHHPNNSVPGSQNILQKQLEIKGMSEKLKELIEKGESIIAASSVKDAEFGTGAFKTPSLKDAGPGVWRSNESPRPFTDEEELRSYWVGLDVKIKRDFMKVSIAELNSFTEGVHDREGRETLKQVLTSAKKYKKWAFWICRTLCGKKFSSAEKCRIHFELEHDADYKPSLEKDRVQMIGKDWTRKISAGDWEPVDVVAAVDMIKNQLEYVKAFARKSKNGWSKEWPLAADKERSKLLKEIKLLLESLIRHQILSCSIRDWLMCFPVEHLGTFQVSQQSLIDSRILGTPQSVCFLECCELKKVRDFLKDIKCERLDGTDLVCRAVDSVLDRIKEKIDFDPQFSFLLLDKRLLDGNNAPYDDEGTINIFHPDVHYAKAPAQGDDIISWLVDYSRVDKIFPRPIREHNLDIWVAVMRAVQFTCRTLGGKYAKKMQLLDYVAALIAVEKLCISEDKRRINLQKDEWNRYASLLCDECEERAPRNCLNTELFLCAVRDVLEGASHPTLDLSGLEDCLNLIQEHKGLDDGIVLNSMRLLKSVATHKILLIDSKILLTDNSRITLLDNLTRLSVFDNRIYMLRLLKPFLLNKIIDMESRAESDAAKAELLLEEEKSKKKKNKRNKKTSTSLPSPLDKTVEQESSAPNLEPEAMVEEESTEPKDTLASERGRLEILSQTDNEVDPGVQNMPGENSLFEHLESTHGGAAARYSSALDMTLKAILNIKVVKEDLKHNEQPSYDDRDEGVTCALQKLFTAFKSEMIEGVYGVLLSDIIASLKDVISMSGGAAEVLVRILQFWPCGKDPETESLVNSLFMLEENERMSCRKCRREPNYSEQRSYGIVMAADSIRDLKCALGNMKFVDILRLIHMENKMLCDIKKGGCGETNFVRRFMSRYPTVFTIVLEWEKSETEKEISETTKALEWEIDISRLYEGKEPNTKYRLVSMVCCGEEDEHICLAYGNNRWVNLIHDSLAREDVGNWKSVVRFCEDKKVRPEILFYEAAPTSIASV